MLATIPKTTIVTISSTNVNPKQAINLACDIFTVELCMSLSYSWLLSKTDVIFIKQ